MTPTPLIRENREHMRISCEMSVEVVLEGIIKEVGRLYNISTGGAYVVTSLPLQSDTKIVLFIDLPGLPECSEIPCLVRWVNEEGGAGLKFERLSLAEIEATDKLNEFCDFDTN